MEKDWNFSLRVRISSWIYRVATFTALDAIKKRDSRKQTNIDDLEEANITGDSTSLIAPPPEQVSNLDNQVIGEGSIKALNRLGENHKVVLI